MTIDHSEWMRNFALPLLAGLNVFQVRHALNVLEAVVVCDLRPKTLAGLTRCLLLAHADHFALADFFRVSPWSAEQVRERMIEAVLIAACKLQVLLGEGRIALTIVGMPRKTCSKPFDGAAGTLCAPVAPTASCRARRFPSGGPNWPNSAGSESRCHRPKANALTKSGSLMDGCVAVLIKWPWSPKKAPPGPL
ncbi:MAG: hypothetical protein ABIQ99_12365, partial [Thermoflexales bacterium]